MRFNKLLRLRYGHLLLLAAGENATIRVEQRLHQHAAIEQVTQHPGPGSFTILSSSRAGGYPLHEQTPCLAAPATSYRADSVYSFSCQEVAGV